MKVDSPLVDDLENHVSNNASRQGCGFTYSDEGNHEEPHGQYPEEECDNKSKCAQDLCVDKAITLQVKVVGQRVGHTNQSQAGERWRANGDEHGASMFTVGVSDLHEATNVVRVHQDSDSETQTLTPQARHENRHSRLDWLVFGNDRRDGTSEHDGEDGQKPRRHEAGQLVRMMAKEIRVLEACKTECDERVGPESHLHGSDGPSTVRMIHLVRLDDVFLRAGDDGCDGQEEGTEEETFALMSNRLLERAGELGEAEDQCHGNSSEQEDVENVEDGADNLETRKGVWLDGNERSKTASSHGQGVVGPCVVLYPLAKGEVRLVRVLLSRNLGVLVPF